MTTFLIQRNIQNAANLRRQELVDIACASGAVVESLGVPCSWFHSCVAGDKMCCAHETNDVESVKEHARRGNFWADLVVEVSR